MAEATLTGEAYGALVRWGDLDEKALKEAAEGAVARGISIEHIIIYELKVPKRSVLKALSLHFGLPYFEYDERIPLPSKLLEGLDQDRLSLSGWFPVAEENGVVIVAAANPSDPSLMEEVKKGIPGASDLRLFVALEEDIQWYIQDYLHASPGKLIGTERTGLAYWRNTMALWRTRLACYRTDMAMARTDLAALRGGLGMVLIADALLRSGRLGARGFLFAFAAFGAILAVYGLVGYLKVRKTSFTPPGDQTLVEVTSATLSHLEHFHDLEAACKFPLKRTMLGRLLECIAPYCTVLNPSPPSRERTHLARERNVLASQRTVAACYRTIYARARTGLSFIRTGVSFSAAGLIFAKHFPLSAYSILEVGMFVIGIFMIVDGVLWYLPARGEQSEPLRCRVLE